MSSLPEFTPLNAFPPSTGDAISISFLTNPDIKAADDECLAGNDHASVLVNQLIRTGIPPENLQTCLQNATHSGNGSLVEQLLAIGVPFDTGVLCTAIDRGALNMLSVFLTYGWEINRETNWCTAPLLSYAIQVGAGTVVVSWFLSHGADPNASCQAGLTPLSTAISVAPLAIIQQLLNHCGPDTVFQGQLLHFAARRSDSVSVQVVQLILRRCQPYFNAIMWDNQPLAYECYKITGLGTPLHEAAREGRPEIAEALLREGASTSIHDTRGRTAIELAEIAGNVEVVKVLHNLEKETASSVAKI
ncbi:ankyrin repeat domain-containing 50-like [Lecanosticta acicola]|uniref:Ankyrin repeat domain-containing 50-like n=1 Tax=Lecanosticta acicola TaxID=111012 RepID=A0AAI9E8C7_9PEZI|nr:ankyrin repeat domain-containing 50-like [Lecanosticta acicola]